MHENESFIIARHADKGKWEVKEDDLRARLPQEQANLVMTILGEEFPQWKEIPLKLEGIVRSLKLGEELFAELPERSILVATDSGRDRAQLTRALVTARVQQLEQEYNKEHGKDAKVVDMLRIDGKEITDMLSDAHPDTWPPYADMMEKEGISEGEALARWINDMNKPGATVPPEQAPQEASKRYRDVIQKIRQMVTSEQTPVTLFGAGHSGSLGQVRHEELGRPTTADNSPQFCEMFKFDQESKLIGSKRVEI